MKKDLIINSQDLLKAIRESEDLGDGKIRIALDIDYEEVPKKISPSSENLTDFEKLVLTYKINLKDVREIIKLTHSYWDVLRTDPWATTEIIFKYYQIHGNDNKEKVYSPELILASLKALAKGNPIQNFYDRIKRVDPRDFDTVEEYFKHLYTNEETQE